MTATTAMTRFTSKVTVEPNGCWRWTASTKGPTGYGQFSLNGRPRLAHRVAYEMFIGPIPDGLQIDHLCRNRWCVNPAHLEPVTNQENGRRGRAVRTHCPHGHPYDAINTAVYRGWRTCRECNRQRARSNKSQRDRNAA